MSEALAAAAATLTSSEEAVTPAFGKVSPLAGREAKRTLVVLKCEVRAELSDFTHFVVQNAVEVFFAWRTNHVENQGKLIDI